MINTETNKEMTDITNMTEKELDELFEEKTKKARYSTTPVGVTEEGYEFQVLRKGSVINEYFVDFNEFAVSWYSNFDCGIKHFDMSLDKAAEYALLKVKELLNKAIDVEYSIVTG